MRIFNEDGTPMMAQQEIDIINNLLQQKQAKTVLEWGSGTSTVYFPTQNPFIERWIAMEHNKTYVELFGDAARAVKAQIVIKEGQEYIKYPSTLGIKFDFILIDGLYRLECVDEAFNVANKDAIILLHDACRQESAPILHKYEGRYKLLIEGEKKLSNGFYAHRGIAQFYL